MNVPRREKKGESAFARLADARRLAGPGRPRWASLAGSIAAGVVVGVWLWSGASRAPLGPDVLEHVRGEPAALAAGTRPDAATVAKVLDRGGIRLRSEAGTVVYASSCRFRGHPVTHLVIQGAAGRLTVLVLRDEQIETPIGFTGQGFSGRIVPAGTGSIAVVSTADADLDRLAGEVRAAVEWR